MRNFIDDYFDQNHKTLDLNRKGSAYVISLKTTDKSRNSSQIFGETSIIHIGGKYLTRVSLSYNLQNISKETCN
ncbi:MAG: hypothetical protein KC589_09015, partial [Nanoarchaeota archaeon]|nr:hypothetical protein [Nanoarchaeota archaeon]